ncbi:MAG TPA: AI-2E family transporter [Oleiagrimonas sp.]|nr:AI-2E family transporter [Oleiagrimonas sp.]
MTMNNEPEKPASSADISQPLNYHAIAMVGIFVLMVLYTMYFAAPILIPITMALLLALILSSVIKRMERIRIPAPLGAALILIILLSAFGAGIYGLSSPAMHWIKQAPQALQELESSFHHSHGPIQELRQAGEKIGNVTDIDTRSANEPNKVQIVGQPNIINRILTSTPAFLSNVGITVVLLYFLLAAGDSFLRSLVRVVPRLHDKKLAVEVARGVQHNISRYLMTITLINLCLGVADGLILWALGMPDPILWGALIMVFNFVPYAGAACMLVILSLVALVTYNHLGAVLLVPALILAMSILEGHFITPHTLGRRLALSPVAIFVTLVTLGWMWGIVGAIIAVPLLAAFKLLCEEIEALNPIAEFLTA